MHMRDPSVTLGDDEFAPWSIGKDAPELRQPTIGGTIWNSPASRCIRGDIFAVKVSPRQYRRSREQPQHRRLHISLQAVRKILTLVTMNSRLRPGREISYSDEK
jgi:hypothetical protein